ncbi:MAG: ABC transporter ATP-binding protein [Lachnospiraceae bacterium]
MTDKSSVAKIIGNTIRKHPGLSILLVLAILLAIVFSLLPPLVLEEIVNHLVEGKQILFSMAIGYFLIVAISGLMDALKESLITTFGQKVTHQIRSAMSEKLKHLPASYFIDREPGVTASRFVNDVNTVEHLFTSGIISMAADLCKLLSILIIIFTKSIGLGLVLLVVTPLLFWMTRIFQKRMLNAQMENRIAVGKTNQQIPEALKNMRTIRVLHQEHYMLKRYGATIEQSFRAQERSNFYDAVYSPMIVSVSAMLIGMMMVASAQSGTMQVFFGMSVGTAAAVIAYVGSFFGPLESIGMEIQNVQSAVAGVQRINEFLRETEQKTNSEQLHAENAAVQLSDVCFRYKDGDPEIFHHFNYTVTEGETVVLSGRTGAGKSTLVKLIAGLYQPQQGMVRVFGKAPDAISENDKRRLFGYVEQQFRLVPGSVADQVSLSDPQVSETQIRQALDMVGLGVIVDRLPYGIHTPCTEALLSQGQFQLLSIARAVVLNPKILLLDEITANLDSRTEAMVLSALRAASLNRTVISVSHRLYGGEHNPHIRFLTL